MIVSNPSEPSSLAARIPRLGLMAGAGRLPFLIADAAAQISLPVTAFAVEGITPPELAGHVDCIHWMQLDFSRLIRQLHADKIQHVVMVGRIPHNAIWHYRGFDLRSLRLLANMVTRKADSILGTVVQELERENIHVIDQTLLLRDSMPSAGLLTPKRPLTAREQKDIEFGYPIARQIAGMDIGQTIVVKDLAVVAVEGLEGTDETILRAGRIAAGNVVVIKVAKPQQDSRFDVPVIGPDTIRTLHAAGGGAIAFQAGNALFCDPAECIALAHEYKIAIAAV